MGPGAIGGACGGAGAAGPHGGFARLEGDTVGDSANAKMKAVVMRRYGGPEVLEYTEIERPVPGRGEALVRVRACSLNAADIMAREGRYKPNKGRFPHILGCDISGEVVAYGPETEPTVPVGQRVTIWWVVPCWQCEQCLSGRPNTCALNYRYLGAHLWGGYAEYVKVPALNLIPLPDAVSFEDGAAFLNTYGTAWHALVTRANIRPGETVLIQAAGSGVSTAAIQIARLVGARIFATSSSDEKLERARRMGATEVLNYQTQDIPEEVMRLTGKRGVDLVLEHVGGPVFEASIRSLTRGGRLVTVGGTATYDVGFNVAYVFHKQLSIIGSNSCTKQELEAMLPLLADGRLDPVIDAVLPLPRVAEAQQRLESRQSFGKVLVKPEDGNG